MRFRLVEEFNTNRYTEDDIRDMIDEVFEENKFVGYGYTPNGSDAPWDAPEDVETDIDEYDIDEIILTEEEFDGEKYQVIEIFMNVGTRESYEKANVDIEIVPDEYKGRDEIKEHIVDKIQDAIDDTGFEFKNDDYGW